MVSKRAVSKNFQNSELQGFLLVLAATALLSFRSILVKLAYAENISVMNLFYYRFLITVPLLLSFSAYIKKKELIQAIKNKKIALSCIIAGFFGYYLATLLDFHSLTLMDASVNRLIVYTFPIYILVFNSLLKKTWPTLRECAHFLSIQVGLFLVLGNFSASQAISTKGAIFAFLAAISYSVYILINQEIGKKIGSILFTSYSVSSSFLFINIHYFSTLSTENLHAISMKGWGIILTMAIFCTCLPLVLISEGIKKIGAPRFSLINATGPIMTIFLCYVMLDERMSLIQLTGAAIIIGVLSYSETRKKRQRDATLTNRRKKAHL